MPDAQIRTEPPDDHPHVLVAAIDNPPVNVMNTALYLRMTELFEGIAADGKVRCIVLTGAGSRAFVAGSDVRDFAVLTPDTALARARVIRSAFTAIRDCVVPVIGAINGPALAPAWRLPPPATSSSPRRTRCLVCPRSMSAFWVGRSTSRAWCLQNGCAGWR